MVTKTKDFMESAVKRPGVFAAKAKKAGMTTAAYATSVVKKLKGKTTTAAERTLLKQAVLAKTFKKYRPK